ncbi:MAG: YgaP family membrane protein [Ignavibacterium sp.]|uniref:YgaP family membrane protein n=1 Tax=Ignavibacterium sp. TaxID=2651167 RepID=UPI004049032A
MTTNIGSADKVIRIVLGLAILAIGLLYESWWGLVGLVPLVTAFIGVCPAYSLLKISTKTKVPTEKM